MNFAADPVPGLLPDLLLFDSATDLMCVRDLQGRFVRVNKAWESTLGISTDEVVNTPLLPLIHPADVPATLQRMAEADQAQQIVNFVNRYRRRDGRYRYMEWRAQRLGNVILGRARDVTVHRQHQRELDLTHLALEETLADISSKVRAPSDEILSAVQALGRTKLTLAQRAMVQTLGNSVEILGDLVSQLVEREREAAWAAFLPTVEQRRSRSSHRLVNRSVPKAAPPEPQKNPDLEPLPLSRPTAAVQTWVLEMLQHVGRNAVFYRTFRDLPSTILGLLSIRLEYLGQCYPRRLQSLSAQSGLMSAGRAVALLARMQDVGFVNVAGEFRTGQIRPYRVQATMTRAFVGQLMISLKSLAESDYRAMLAIEAIKEDKNRATPVLVEFAAALLADQNRGEGSLGVRLNGVPSMAKGLAITLSIVADAIRKHGATWEGWIEIALSDYARRFEVSRVHVRRVIENLEVCGLLRDHALPSRLLVTDRFRKEVEDYRSAVCHLLAGILERFI